MLYTCVVQQIGISLPWSSRCEIWTTYSAPKIELQGLKVCLCCNGKNVDWTQSKIFWQGKQLLINSVWWKRFDKIHSAVKWEIYRSTFSSGTMLQPSKPRPLQALGVRRRRMNRPCRFTLMGISMLTECCTTLATSCKDSKLRALREPNSTNWSSTSRPCNQELRQCSSEREWKSF